MIRLFSFALYFSFPCFLHSSEILQEDGIIELFPLKSLSKSGCTVGWGVLSLFNFREIVFSLHKSGKTYPVDFSVQVFDGEQ